MSLSLEDHPVPLRLRAIRRESTGIYIDAGLTISIHDLVFSDRIAISGCLPDSQKPDNLKVWLVEVNIDHDPTIPRPIAGNNGPWQQSA